MSHIPSNQLIYGLHAAEAALVNPLRVLRHAYLTENALSKLDQLIVSRALSTTLCKPAALDELVGAGAVHQGIVLHVEPLNQLTLDQFLDQLQMSQKSSVALLDQITDPHNVGAILRSAAAFGIGALILQTRHSPPLSGALAKAASGALEFVSVIEHVNLARALDQLKDHYFHCIGFDSGVNKIFETTTPLAFQRVCFAFGAEDKGLRRLIREGCNELYALNAPGPIKSLNVSNAAAIVFQSAAHLNTQSEQPI